MADEPPSDSPPLWGHDAIGHGPPPRAVEPPFICADCGRTLTLRRGKWADTDEGPGRYRMICREHVSTKPDGTLFLEAADYHYVAGETQRRWVPPSVR